MYFSNSFTRQNILYSSDKVRIQQIFLAKQFCESSMQKALINKKNIKGTIRLILTTKLPAISIYSFYFNISQIILKTTFLFIIH